jgi:hypothetical protein
VNVVCSARSCSETQEPQQISMENLAERSLGSWRQRSSYGPSVQVKTWSKPHDRTSSSKSFVDFAAPAMAKRR